jgi:hypothetical protein
MSVAFLPVPQAYLSQLSLLRCCFGNGFVSTVQAVYRSYAQGAPGHRTF